MVTIRMALQKVKDDYDQLIPAGAILQICEIPGTPYLIPFRFLLRLGLWEADRGQGASRPALPKGQPLADGFQSRFLQVPEAVERPKPRHSVRAANGAGFGAREEPLGKFRRLYMFCPILNVDPYLMPG